MWNPCEMSWGISEIWVWFFDNQFTCMIVEIFSHAPFFVDKQQNDKIMEIILLNHLFFQTCSVWPPLIHQNLTISTHHINIQIFSRVFFNFISMCVLPFFSFITVTTMNSSAQHRAPLSTMWLFAFINCFFFFFLVLSFFKILMSTTSCGFHQLSA